MLYTYFQKSQPESGKNRNNTPSNDTGGSQVVVCAHELKTPVQCSAGDMKYKTDTYFIFSIGDNTSISFPDQFYYHDLLHSWQCYTWQTENPILATRIRHYWADLKQMSKNPRIPHTVAEHMICFEQKEVSCRNAREERIQCDALKVELNNGNIRFPAGKGKKKVSLEVWSHEPRIGPLEKHLSQWRNDNREITISELTNQIRTRPIFRHEQLPKSFKFPTIQFSMLCFPNVGSRMGRQESRALSLLLEDENDAHHQFAMQGVSARRINADFLWGLLFGDTGTPV